MRSRLTFSFVSLSANETGEIPKRFQIFRKGVNTSTKGKFLYDDESEKLLKKEQEQRGIDMMIDLEHLSLDQESENYDPDARGWFVLEFADDGLYAKNVKWTPDGERRLKEKTQRYISPAFVKEKKTGRVVSLFNVALVGVPAMNEIPALVAANNIGGNLEELVKIATALGLSEAATLEDILAAINELRTQAAETDEETASDGEETDEKATNDEEETDEKASDDKEDDKEKLSARFTTMLLTRLNKLEKQLEKNERNELIRLNANKLPKALEGWARSVDLATLSAFFKNAPLCENPVNSQPKNRQSAPVLSPDDLEVCNALGIDQSKFLKENING